MHKFLMTLVLSAAIFSSSAFAASVPANAHACVLIAQGTQMNQCVFSCDGQASESIMPSSFANGAATNLSSYISQFASAGYTTVSCQENIGPGIPPQYTCTFVK